MMKESKESIWKRRYIYGFVRRADTITLIKGINLERRYIYDSVRRADTVTLIILIIGMTVFYILDLDRI